MNKLKYLKKKLMPHYCNLKTFVTNLWVSDRISNNFSTFSILMFIVHIKKKIIFKEI